MKFTIFAVMAGFNLAWAAGRAGTPSALPEPSLQYLPGQRTPADFSGGTSPFADANLSSPLVTAPAPVPEPEAKAQALNALVSKLQVNGVFLTNDPAYRTVLLNHHPLRVGEIVPASLLGSDAGGEVTLKAIEPGKLVFSATPAAKNSSSDATSKPAPKGSSIEPAHTDPIVTECPYSFPIGERKPAAK